MIRTDWIDGMKDPFPVRPEAEVREQVEVKAPYHIDFFPNRSSYRTNLPTHKKIEQWSRMKTETKREARPVVDYTEIFRLLNRTDADRLQQSGAGWIQEINPPGVATTFQCIMVF